MKSELTSEEEYALSRLLNSPLKVPSILNQDMIEKVFGKKEDNGNSKTTNN